MTGLLNKMGKHTDLLAAGGRPRSLAGGVDAAQLRRDTGEHADHDAQDEEQDRQQDGGLGGDAAALGTVGRRVRRAVERVVGHGSPPGRPGPVRRTGPGTVGGQKTSLSALESTPVTSSSTCGLVMTL